MKVFIDGDDRGKDALNSVCVVVNKYGRENYHVTITHEGIVVDLVVDGEVIQTMSRTHEELMAYDAYPDSRPDRIENG